MATFPIDTISPVVTPGTHNVQAPFTEREINFDENVFSLEKADLSFICGNGTEQIIIDDIDGDGSRYTVSFEYVVTPEAHSDPCETSVWMIHRRLELLGAYYTPSTLFQYAFEPKGAIEIAKKSNPIRGNPPVDP